MITQMDKIFKANGTELEEEKKEKPSEMDEIFRREEARCDAKSLIHAAEVKADGARLKAAKKEVKRMTKEKREELRAMKQV